jgi:hypothetical protein
VMMMANTLLYIIQYQKGKQPNVGIVIESGYENETT